MAVMQRKSISKICGSFGLDILQMQPIKFNFLLLLDITDVFPHKNFDHRNMEATGETSLQQIPLD